MIANAKIELILFQFNHMMAYHLYIKTHKQQKKHILSEDKIEIVQ